MTRLLAQLKLAGGEIVKLSQKNALEVCVAWADVLDSRNFVFSSNSNSDNEGLDCGSILIVVEYGLDCG